MTQAARSTGISTASFLAGGGEMGARIAAFDWAATRLGPVAAWPQSLRSPLSMMLPSRAQIILFWGPDFTVFYNDAYRPVFGAKHPDALGLPGSVAWREVWDTQLHDLLEGVVRTGQAFSASDLMFLIERHGFQEETYFDVSYDPIRVESGDVGGVYCIVTETTERVVSERRMVLLKDLAARNASARTPREACALAMEVLAGHPDVAFALAYLDGTLQAATPGAEASLAGSESSRVHEFALRTGGGTPNGRLVVGLNPRRPFDARYRGFLELVADQISSGLTTAQAYEDTLRRAEALAEIDRAKTAFFSNVSHEFRTPLTLMQGPTQRLLDGSLGPLSSAQREQAEIVSRNTQRLLKLVNTLLDFSRLEAGRLQATFRRTDLAALTADLAAAFRSAIEHAGLAFEVDCAPLADPAYVDQDLWEKIVLNLLSNALKHTFAGRIAVSLEERGGEAVLRVSDTGTGIPDGELPRIFERFHRVDGARARTHEGSGIGLALTHELVRMHGGTIEVASRVGDGTTFTVRIPVGCAHLPADRIDAIPAQESTRTAATAFARESERWLASGSTSAQRSGEHILVVDDNADMRDYLAQLLGEWRVTTVVDGAAALEHIRDHGSPDLVISDVMMPALDGFGLLERLRGDPATAGIPLLMLSARAGDEARVQGLDAGADDYLTKPFSANLLRARVRSLLALSRARREAELQRQHLRALFVQAPTPIMLMRGSDHVIELANELACRTLGRAEDELIGKPLLDALPELAGQPFKPWLDDVLRTGEAHVGREVAAVLGPDASQPPRHFNFVYAPVREVDGTIGGVMTIAFDVSEEVRAREQTTMLQAAAEAANEAKDEFLAMLGHELRNPLAPIKTALELMELRAPAEGALEREIIMRQVRHLERLVDDLLDVSRIAHAKVELRLARLELSEVTRLAVEAVTPIIEDRRHRLHVDVPDGGLPVLADPARLVQVLTNLLNNAAKYTEPGGEVRLTARRSRGDVEILVEDNGTGIAADALPRVFDMFMQGRQSAARPKGGLGLGLTIARSMVQMHRGTITARSGGPGRGSTFVVRLPLAQDSVLGSVVPQHSARPAALGRRILVVDDNVDAAATLVLGLEAAGHAVAVAYDGPSALKACAAMNPDVVLLDLGLPVMDGYEVAQHLLQRPHPPTIVALSGYGRESDTNATRAAGFSDHLVKPVDLARLFEALDRLPSLPRSAATVDRAFAGAVPAAAAESAQSRTPG